MIILPWGSGAFLHLSGGRLHHYMTTLACLAGGQSFVHLGESCYLFIYLFIFFWGGVGGCIMASQLLSQCKQPLRLC